MHMMTDRQLADRFQVSRVSIWRWSKTNAQFPKPIVISPGCVRWRVTDIVAYEVMLATKAASASPAPSAAA